MTSIETRRPSPTEYKPPLRGENLQRYRENLTNISRWIDKTGESVSRKPENSWEHTMGVLDIVDHEMSRFPALSKVLDLNAVRDMIWLHDGPEIIAGDHYMGSETFTKNYSRQKIRERAGARILLRGITDPGEKQDLEATFERYDKCAPDDAEAQFAHLIDKFQGTRFGLEHGGIPSLRDPDLDDLEEKRRKENATLSLTRIVHFATPLMALLDSPARDELQEFTTEEIERFREHGFASEVDVALTNLQTIESPAA